MDCVNPPLTTVPSGMWMCPNHAEHAEVHVPSSCETCFYSDFVEKCHGQCLASWTPSQEVHVLCTQGCHALCFCTPVALIFTLLANLILYTCIVSTREIKCTCNSTSLSSILGHYRCYKLLAKFTALFMYF